MKFNIIQHNMSTYDRNLSHLNVGTVGIRDMVKQH